MTGLSSLGKTVLGDDTAIRRPVLHTRIDALPRHARQAAWDLLHAGADEQTLAVLVDELHSYSDRMGRAIADRDRGIREAIKTAEDCAHHGRMIRDESHQAHWNSELARVHDEERGMWVELAHRLRDAAAPEHRAAVDKWFDRADQQMRRIRGSRKAPTFADCQRAGRCEHPPVAPHAACEQLRQLDLFEEAVS